MPGFGSGAVLGVSRQNSYGTALNSYYKMPFANHDFNYGYSELTDDSITGKPDWSDRTTGIAGVTGNITANFHPLAHGHLMRSCFGWMVSSAVGSGFTHTFNPATQNFDAGNTLPPLTIYVDQGESQVSSAYQLSDCMVNQAELSLAAGQYLRATYSIIGKTAVLMTKQAIADWPQGIKPLLWSAASIHWGGAAVTRFQDFRLTLSNNIGMQDRIAGAKTHTYFFRDGFREFGKLSATADMAMTDWLAVKNETEGRLAISFLGVTSISSGVNEFFTMDFPRFVWTAHPIGVNGAGVVTVTLEGRAMYSTTSSTIATFTLQNTMANSIY
jgi:hypothetical protein